MLIMKGEQQCSSLYCAQAYVTSPRLLRDIYASRKPTCLRLRKAHEVEANLEKFVTIRLCRPVTEIGYVGLRHYMSVSRTRSVFPKKASRAPKAALWLEAG